MQTCDLCSGPLDTNHLRVQAKMFRLAVRNGLRPREQAAVLGAEMGVGEDAWVELAMRDDTDWMLCRDCFAQYEEYGWRMDHESFVAAPVAEADAKARAAMAESGRELVRLQVVHEPGSGSKHQYGTSLESALQYARMHISSEHGLAGEPRVLAGEEGDFETEAMSEEEARAQWQEHGPDGNGPRGALVDLACVAKPHRGVLGAGRKPGTWHGHWRSSTRSRCPTPVPPRWRPSTADARSPTPQ